VALEDEHGVLLQSARNTASALDRFFESLTPLGDVSYQQHYDFALRSRWLSYLLDGVLTLVRSEAYPSSFAVLRSAIEHHVIDLLLFLGDRYQQVFTGVSEDEWREYQDAQERGEDWTKNILDWQWSSGTLRVVRSGPHVEGSGTLSIYYGFLSDFDPFKGPPEDQQYLTTDFTRPEVHERWARKQQALYSDGLRWKRLRENLALNGFYDERGLAELGVHFRFLSAFVHPVSEAYVLLYGQNSPANPKSYDHYASELALLYVNAIAAKEIRALQQMVLKEPQVGIGDAEGLDSIASTAEQVSAHLWFPGGSPHDFDRVEEANHRGLVDGSHVPVGSPERVRPEELREEDVRYYRNPLRRIRKMHYSANELTGFPYQSPWERRDAFWLQ
jgi:hypothetical protein